MPACPKPRPKLLDRRDVQATIRATDRHENDKVKKRSNGVCEVTVRTWNKLVGGYFLARCDRRAAHIHHRLSGLGRRNRGPSILAANKWHVCETCHTEIHGHVLKPYGNYFERMA